MMVTYVRGHFKNVHGTLEFDPEFAALSRVEAVSDVRGLWMGSELASYTPLAYSYA
jgi:polyisoprenoid-binding protein YceI